MARALTVDLEDWFQVYNFSRVIPFCEWHSQEQRIVRNTQRLLDILDQHNTKATFFVLGWTAEHYPFLVKEIQARGHEIACHGYNHKPIFKMNRHEFKEDLEKAVNAIKKATGFVPKGFRAPSFSVRKDTLWALDVLKQKGFEYDSSMVPVSHPDYGIKGIPNKPFEIKGVKEYPISTSYGFPVGGGYFKAYPYWFTKFLLKQNRHAVFYIHPWEFDCKMPRYNLPLLKKFRHYIGLKSTEKKFRKLLKDFKFGRIDKLH